MDLANAIAAPDFGGNEFAAAYHFAHRFGVAFEIGSGLGDVVGFAIHLRFLSIGSLRLQSSAKRFVQQNPVAKAFSGCLKTVSSVAGYAAGFVAANVG